MARALAAASSLRAKRRRTLLRWLAPAGLAALTLLGLFAHEVARRASLIAPRPSTMLYDRHGAFLAQIESGGLDPGRGAPRSDYGYWPLEQVPRPGQRRHPGAGGPAFLGPSRRRPAGGRAGRMGAICAASAAPGPRPSQCRWRACSVRRRGTSAARSSKLASPWRSPGATGGTRCYCNICGWCRSARTATASPTPRAGISTSRSRI